MPFIYAETPMKSVDLKEPKEREYCDCPARHFKGRCDVDFPATTAGLPYTPRQKELMISARKQLGMPPPVFSDELSVPTKELSVTDTDNPDDVTDKVCPECHVTFNPKRADAVYCSTKCRVRNSRRS